MRSTFLGIVLIMLLAGISVAAFEMQEDKTLDVFGKTWYVGGPIANFSSIQEAVYDEEVSDGDTIEVHWNCTPEYVHVNKTLRIARLSFDPPGWCPTVLGFDICAPSVEINGFTVWEYVALDANSSNAVIHNNNLTQSPYDGIYIGPESYNNTLAQNNVSRFAIEHTGDIEHFVQNISETNKIGGKPIYYWVNHRDERIPANASHVVVVNSENITVEGLSFASNDQGVLIVNSTDINVTNVAFKSHEEAILARDSSGVAVKDLTFQSPYSIDYKGVFFSNVNDSCIQNVTFDIDMVPTAIYLSDSWNNTIRENVGVSVTRSGWQMVYLAHSHGNSIESNDLRNDGFAGSSSHALYLHESRNNIIAGNNFTNAQYGLFLYWSNSNTIAHNNFVGNENDTYQESSVDNKFDNGLEGNYWAAYNGIDDDGDGIDDDAYVTPAFVDNCPLNKTWSAYGVYDRTMKNLPDPKWAQKLHTFSNGTLGWPPRGFGFSWTVGEIALKVTCGYDGFLSITIPRDWVDIPFDVSVDDGPPDYALTVVDSTYSSTYITFARGNHTIKITGLEVGNITGDLNGDHIVDILDAIILASNFNAEE